MIQAKHCDLCQFPKRNLKTGLTCGLTNKKPAFKISCSKIKFSNSSKEYLPHLLSQIENLKKRKAPVYLKFILLAFTGVLVILANHTLLEKTFKMDLSYSSSRSFNYSLLIYAVGAGLLSKSFWLLYIYKKQLKELESEKNEINTVLNNYNLNTESLLKINH